MLAEAVPLAWGANATEKEALYPAGMVIGKLRPLTVNPAWLTLAEDTVTGPLLAVSVADWACVVPTTTFPKLIVAGETASCPGALPDPLSGMDSVGSEALELATMFPVTLPPVSGAKVTANVTL
jgi:hypothetical protein